MRSVIGQQILSYEELNPYLTDIVTVMNSRPLIPDMDSPTALSALIPGRFLIRTKLNALPEPDIRSEKITLREPYKLVTQLSQSLWKKWQKELSNSIKNKEQMEKIFSKHAN